MFNGLTEIIREWYEAYSWAVWDFLGIIGYSCPCECLIMSVLLRSITYSAP